MVDETQQRILLLLNHVLMQEPDAMRRLAPSKGKTLRLRWGRFNMGLSVTAAGLFDRFETSGGSPVADGPAPDGLAKAPLDTATVDLSITLMQESPWELARHALRGERPPLRIEGDARFASDINWLVDHVRWDIEEDLSKIVGDAPARALAAAARRVLQALREFSPPPFGAGRASREAAAGPAGAAGQAGAEGSAGGSGPGADEAAAPR